MTSYLLKALRYNPRTKAISMEKQPMLETADSENWKSTPRRRQKPKFLSLRFYAPTGVFIVQTALLIFGWTFFGITRSRPVPLPAYLAVAAKGNVQPIIMVATLFASFLSAISGFFLHTINSICAGKIRLPAERLCLFVYDDLWNQAGRNIADIQRASHRVDSWSCHLYTGC